MIDLKGKTALVTGSARGIGFAVAKKLAAAGADVLINDIRQEDSERAASEIRPLSEGRTFALAADISNEEEADALIKKSSELLGRLDILVNNAGITQDNILVRMKKEQWDRVIAVNLTGTFLCTRAAMVVMMKQRSGSIINLSSIAGEHGNLGQSNYSSSKSGVIGFTKTVAIEGARRNIRCNAVAPGFVQTEMTDAIPEKIRKELVAKILLGRAGLPDDIANGVLFLASDMASYITGHVLDINGGGFM